MKFLNNFFIILIAVFIAGCSKNPFKSEQVFNLQPEKWYSKIIKDIRQDDLKKADIDYTYFASEYVDSPLLEQMTLILAQAHINDNEYILANYYLDQYIKKFGTPSKIEFAKYLKIRANFESFSRPNTNSYLIDQSIAQINEFLYQYPYSIYRPLVDTIRTRYMLARYYMDKETLNLYKRLGRKISQKVFEKRIQNSPLKDSKMIPPKLPWYIRMF